MLTIEAGGTLIARNVDIMTDIVKVDKKGSLTLTGQGSLTGTGVGAGRSGGGYGGRGGAGNTAGMDHNVGVQCRRVLVVIFLILF